MDSFGLFLEWIKKFKDVQKDIRQLDNRLSRIEGRYEERWVLESKKNGTEEKKMIIVIIVGIGAFVGLAMYMFGIGLAERLIEEDKK